jgi:hypothetical protein
MSEAHERRPEIADLLALVRPPDREKKGWLCWEGVGSVGCRVYIPPGGKEIVIATDELTEAMTYKRAYGKFSDPNWREFYSMNRKNENRPVIHISACQLAAGRRAFMRNRKRLDDLYVFFSCDLDAFLSGIYRAMDRAK